MADRAFVRFPIMLTATTMANVERQMKLEGITPDPTTGHMPFEKALTTLITEYSEGNVVLLPRGKHKPVAPNAYIEAHK